MPMVYYHVWDNYPYPHYNSISYNSNDVVLAISKVTEDIVRNVAPGVDCRYVPHSVDTDVFKKKDPESEAKVKDLTLEKVLKKLPKRANETPEEIKRRVKINKRITESRS